MLCVTVLILLFSIVNFIERRILTLLYGVYLVARSKVNFILHTRPRDVSSYVLHIHNCIVYIYV